MAIKNGLSREHSQAPPQNQRRKRILVVDDEYLIAQDLAEAIGEAGCEVVGPASGLRDALRLLRDGQTDGAVIDLNLGRGGEGVLLAEKLTAQFCPFVVISGDDVACAEFKGRFPGAHLIGKPAPRHELCHAIAKLTEGLDRPEGPDAAVMDLARPARGRRKGPRAAG